MAFEKLTKNIKGLTDNTQEYVKTSSEYYKLKFFKNSMKGLIGVANLILRGLVALISLLFFSVGIAIIISNEMDSQSAGYFIVGAFYFLIFLLVFFFVKKPLERFLLIKYSKMAFNEKNTAQETEMHTKPSQDIIHESVH